MHPPLIVFFLEERRGAHKTTNRPTGLFLNPRVRWPREFITSMQNETAHLFVSGIIFLERTLPERHSLHWEVLSWKIDKNAPNGAWCHFDWKCTENCIYRVARPLIRKRRHQRTKLPATWVLKSPVYVCCNTKHEKFNKNIYAHRSLGEP